MKLQERVENLEKFIFSAVIVWISFKSLEDASSEWSKAIYVAIILAAGSICVQALAAITSNAVDIIKVSVIKSIFDFLNYSKNWPGYILVLMVNVGGYFASVWYFEVSGKTFFWALFIEVILIVLWNVKIINEKVRKWILRKQVK